MPTTTNYGWETPVIGGDDDTWGDKLNTAFDEVDADLKTVSDAASAAASTANAALPASQMVGAVMGFFRASAPAGWVAADGKTIGNAASGATGRANADTENLYAELWNGTNVSDLPIQTSAGSVTTKGGSAAADFAAGKRLTLPDLRGEFLRGLDGGRGVDASRRLAQTQADEFESHVHGGEDGYLFAMGGGAGTALQFGGGFDDSFASNTAATGGTETRPRNVSTLYCIKL